MDMKSDLPSCSMTSESKITAFSAKLKSHIWCFLIDEFTPVLFLPVMGIGISSDLLYSFPYPHEWLRVLGYIFFALGCIVFFIDIASFTAVIINQPSKFIDLNSNPKIAPFMGCFPMGYMTLVNFVWAISKPKTSVLIFVLWWISVVLALYTSCIVFYFTFIVKLPHNRIGQQDLHLTILFPIVAITVASSQGNMFLQDLPNRQLKLVSLVTSFCLWSIAVCMAFTIITINFWKIFVHKLPPMGLIFTSFLPTGFLGQAGYSIMLVGHNIHHLAHTYMENDQEAMILGHIATYVSGFICLMFIAIGYFMTFIAIASVCSKLSPFKPHKNPQLSKYGLMRFNRGFWATTFPLGTMSLAQVEFANTFDPGFMFFKVMGTIYAVACILCTVVCIAGVLYRIFKQLRHHEV
jgi:tellurite resistance protein TehA-like permease